MPCSMLFLYNYGFPASWLAWENCDGAEPRLFQCGEDCARRLLPELDSCPVAAAGERYFVSAAQFSQTNVREAELFSQFLHWLRPYLLVKFLAREGDIFG